MQTRESDIGVKTQYIKETKEEQPVDHLSQQAPLSPHSWDGRDHEIGLSLLLPGHPFWVSGCSTANSGQLVAGSGLWLKVNFINSSRVSQDDQMSRNIPQMFLLLPPLPRFFRGCRILGRMLTPVSLCSQVTVSCFSLKNAELCSGQRNPSETPC